MNSRRPSEILTQENAKLTGYGTEKRVRYEVEPTSNQECSKNIREVHNCQKVSGYMI
jgi:hypothetical protein